jgi:hypothetical protein
MTYIKELNKLYRNSNKPPVTTSRPHVDNNKGKSKCGGGCGGCPGNSTTELLIKLASIMLLQQIINKIN